MLEKNEHAWALSKHRYEQAMDDLDTAKKMFDIEKYKAANNRAYYSVFHSLRAVLALDRFDAKHHSAIISEFRKRYLKEGILPKEISDVITDTFEIRNDSDYDDDFEPDKDVTLEQINGAEYVLGEIGIYLKNEGVLDE